MNSLNDLNNFSVNVTYDDDRDPFVSFDRLTPVNQTISVLEGQNSDAKVGIEITDIAGYATTQVNYTIDVSSLAGTTVEWSTIPEGCTVTNPSTGVYNIDGINSAAIWDLVKNPTIIQPVEFFGTLTYNSTINYFTNQNKSWSVVVTIEDVEEWDTESLAVYYYPDGLNAVTSVPLLIDNVSTSATTVVTISPSKPELVTTISSNGTGGTVSLNPVTKVYTINGTNAQINSHLASLKLSAITNNVTGGDRFTFTYRAISIQFGSIDARIQIINSELTRYLSLVRSNITYAEDDPEFSIALSTPLITDLEFAPRTGYVLTVTPSPTQAVSSLLGLSGNTIGILFTSNFDETTKVLTLTGASNRINEQLDASTTPGGVNEPFGLKIKIAADFDSNFTLTYNLTTPEGITESKVQTFTAVEFHDEVSATIALNRTYSQGVAGLLFTSSIPQITDLDSNTSTTYTITLSSSLGQFSAPGTTTSSNWTYTGTKSQVNALFSQIAFIPNSASYTNETVNYTQKKGAVTQATASFSLLGPLVYFDNPTPTGAVINLNEGQSHQVSAPTNPTIIISGQALTYNVDVSASLGAQVEWTSIPADCVLSNPSAGIYSISNITTIAQWNTIKNPNVTLSNSYNGSFNYNVSVSWQSGARSINWLNTVNVAEVFPLTTPNSGIFYNSYENSILSYPILIDNGNQTVNWTVTVSSSVPSNLSLITSAGSGGSSNWNNVTKTLIVSGTVAEINSHLSSLKFTTSEGETDFTLTYNAYNETNSEDATVNQNFVFGTTNLAVTRTYLSNQGNNIFSSNTPVILNDGDTGATYTITLSCTNGQFSLQDNTNDLTSSFTYTNNLNQINSYFFSTIKFYADSGVTSNTVITYTQSKNGVQQISKNLNVNYAGAGTISTQTFVVNTSQSFYVPAEHYIYNGKFDYLVVGGGGGCGYARSSESTPRRQGPFGGGGGGGSVVTASDVSIPSSRLFLSIGLGGANATSVSVNGSAGQISFIEEHFSDDIIATAAAGLGGLSTGSNALQAPSGGASGNGFSGGLGGWLFGDVNPDYEDLIAAGGGGGASANGAGTVRNAQNYFSGSGGLGVTSSISGTSVIYAPGGTGGGYSNVVASDTLTVQQGTVRSTSSTPGGGANGAIWVGNSATSTFISATSANKGQVVLRFHP
jgi:hypothetical protein